MRTLSRAALACAMLVPVTMLLTMWAVNGILVIGGRIFPLWVASGFLVLAAVILQVAAAVIRTRSVSPESSPLAPRLTWSLSAATAAFGVVMLFLNYWGGTVYIPVRSTGDECSIVARETNFFRGGSGALYPVNAWGLGLQAMTFPNMDGARPFGKHDYRVQRVGETARISLVGTPSYRPVLDVPCVAGWSFT